MSYYFGFSQEPAITPSPAVAGAPFVISFGVTNTGDQAGDRVFVVFQVLNGYNRSIEEDGWTGDHIAPGQSGSGSWTLSLSSPGEFTIRVIADPTETIAGVSGNGQGDSRQLVLQVVPAA